MKPLFTTFEDFINNISNIVEPSVLNTDSQKEFAHEIYIARILNMMQEYGITMGTAMEWDMDGFFDPPGCMPEEPDAVDYAYELDYYFWTNGLSYEQSLLYHDIALNKHNDISLKPNDGKKSS